MSADNPLSDFPPDQFTIRLFCDACGYQAELDREKVPVDTLISDLTQRLRCTARGSRECSIGII